MSDFDILTRHFKYEKLDVGEANTSSNLFGLQSYAKGTIMVTTLAAFALCQGNSLAKVVTNLV